MTSNERKSALVEKVARAMLPPDADPSYWRFWTDEATAALTVALEEAVKVADWPHPPSAGWHEEAEGRRQAAKDIRALIEDKNDR